MSEKNRICFDCGGAFTEQESEAHSCVPKEPQPSQGAGAEELAESYAQSWLPDNEEAKSYPATKAITTVAREAFLAGRASQDARIGELQKELEGLYISRNNWVEKEANQARRAEAAEKELHRLQDDLCEKVCSEGGAIEAERDTLKAQLAASEERTKMVFDSKSRTIASLRASLALARDHTQKALGLAERLDKPQAGDWRKCISEQLLVQLRAAISQLPGVEKDGERGSDEF